MHSDGLKILLIKRDNQPFQNSWAFPGGFVEIDESLERAAYRELREETGLTDIELRQYRAFGEPGRDPRGRTISIVYYGYADEKKLDLQAGSDASRVQWFFVNDLPTLAFDHDLIIISALNELKF
jgi:8-oxo-dGTP diphosphatase